MSRTTKTTLPLLSLCLMLAAPVLAMPPDADGLGVAAARRAPAHHDPLLDLRRLAAFLELSEEQRLAARELFAAHREAVKPIRDEIRRLAGELQEALSSEAPSPVDVGQLVIDLDAARAEVRALRQQLDEDFAALLDSEQLERYELLKTVLRLFRWPPRGGSAR